jgi:hypothetical protein
LFQPGSHIPFVLISIYKIFAIEETKMWTTLKKMCNIAVVLHIMLLLKLNERWSGYNTCWIRKCIQNCVWTTSRREH